VINAMHAVVYAGDPEATRAFFRDVLGWPSVDAHDGWLIFRCGPSELGVHPTSGGEGPSSWSSAPHHEISLMCDDIDKTVAELEEKGARFAGGIVDRGFGRAAMLEVPGAGRMMLYEPRHPTAHDL
jgi:catechol 2,3-dioxygenase-like lactoylglutathione lyase family enzyme